MKLALLFSILVPCFAFAEARYECVPVTPNKTVAKVIILDVVGPSAQIELWSHTGLISKTAAEYSDDVDAVSYFSETADLNVFFYWSEMQNDGEADGIIDLNVYAENSEMIRARCNNRVP